MSDWNYPQTTEEKRQTLTYSMAMLKWMLDEALKYGDTEFQKMLSQEIARRIKIT